MATVSPSPTAGTKPSTIRLGLGMHSFGEHWRLAKERPSAVKFHDAPSFLDYARRLGASGVQVFIGIPEKEVLKRLRTTQETEGLYLEAQTSLPRDQSDTDRFRKELAAAAEAGANIVRVALLSGRRYENFKSAEDFRVFAAHSWTSLTLAEPEARRAKVKIAVENHKDWLAQELVALMRRLESEHVGVCVDTGNNLALLEDPDAVIAELAPYAASSHLKDMGLIPCSEGFLLSEVPFGDGCLDLAKFVRQLLKANPALRFNIEMITRDPLKVPCLDPGYWPTFERRPASDLARSLRHVREHASPKALPATAGASVEERLRLEELHVKRCLEAGRSLVVF